MPSKLSSRSLCSVIQCAFAVTLSLPAIAHAQPIQDIYTLRVVPASTFTDNVCNDPCVCIIDPIPQPIGGRLYLAPAVSIPEVAILAGPFRFATTNQPSIIAGDANYTTNFDPAILSRLTLATAYGGVLWSIDSGFFTPVNPPFPTLMLNLVSAQSDCTTLHLQLRTVETCPTDFDDGSGNGFPDGAVTIDDLLFYLTSFGSGDPIADIDNGTGSGMPDAAVTIDDLIQFLVHFEKGC